MEVCMHLPITYSTQGTNILLYNNNQFRLFMDKHSNKISDCFDISWVVLQFHSYWLEEQSKASSF